MATARQSERATIEDLFKTPGKAELVNGSLVLMPPTGIDPGNAATEILVSLYRHVKSSGRGRAFGDNVGFLEPLADSGFDGIEYFLAISDHFSASAFADEQQVYVSHVGKLCGSC